MWRPLRLATLAIVALIALRALIGLLDVLAHAAGHLGAGAVALWLAALAAAALLVYRRRRSTDLLTVLPTALPTGRTAIALALIALIGLRALAALAIDAPLISDFKDYHDLAVGVLGGGPWLRDGRPMGWPWLLAAAYAVTGPTPAAGEWLNVAFGGASGMALWWLVRHLAGPGPALGALALFACWPAHALMTPVLGTEVVYGLAFLAAMGALVRARPAEPISADPLAWPLPAGWAVAAGALTGLAQYIRPTTLALVPAAVVWLALAGRRPRVAAALIGLYLAGLLAVLAPVAEWNHRTHGKWSLTTSSYGGWSLLVGMNQRHVGMWNVDDDATAQRLGGLAAVDAYARAEGLRRLTKDPVATARLVAAKFPIMWAMEDYGTYWALGTAPEPEPRRMALLTLLAQTFYAVVTALAAWALWRRRIWDAAWTPLFLGLLLLVGVHSLLEVQGRYHFYWTPLFIALAATCLAPAKRDQGHS